MDLKQAAQERHTVRKYLDKPIPTDVQTLIDQRIEDNNEKHHLAIKLVTNDNTGIWAVMKLVAKNVNNFIVLAGDDADDLGERLGYASADLMLYAQALGLNTWWIGGSYNKSVRKFVGDKKVVGIVTIGYGATQGVQHKMKTYEQVAHYEGEAPEWFKQGIAVALLAPTAINKMAANFTGKGDEVHLEVNNGAFSGVDKGIIKFHFEIGAGTEHFRWI